MHADALLRGVGDRLDQSASRVGVEVVATVVVGQSRLQGVVALQARHVDARVEGLVAGDELVFYLARGHCGGRRLVWWWGMMKDRVLKRLRRSKSRRRSGE